MTAQIDDLFRYQDQVYSLAGISGDDLFHPITLGLHPVGTSTNCWRGYQAVYSLAENSLLLTNLHINLFEPGEGYIRQQGPSIRGVAPIDKNEKNTLFNNNYFAVNYPLDFTGRLLIAEGFIRDLYVHMGFHPPWKYERVIELFFDRGHLTGAHDRSHEMAKMREQMIKKGKIGPEDLWQTLARKAVDFIRRAIGRTD